MALTVVVSLPLVLGGIIGRLVQGSAYPDDAFFFAAFLGLYAVLCGAMVHALRRRLKGVHVEEMTLLAYGDRIPFATIRQALDTGSALWIKAIHQGKVRWRLLHKSDFEDLQAAVGALEDGGVRPEPATLRRRLTPR